MPDRGREPESGFKKIRAAPGSGSGGARAIEQALNTHETPRITPPVSGLRMSQAARYAGQRTKVFNRYRNFQDHAHGGKVPFQPSRSPLDSPPRRKSGTIRRPKSRSPRLRAWHAAQMRQVCVSTQPFRQDDGLGCAYKEPQASFIRVAAHAAAPVVPADRLRPHAMGRASDEALRPFTETSTVGSLRQGRVVDRS